MICGCGIFTQISILISFYITVNVFGRRRGPIPHQCSIRVNIYSHKHFYESKSKVFNDKSTRNIKDGPQWTLVQTTIVSRHSSKTD